MFWTHGSFLVEYIKFHKKIETIWWTFDKWKGLLTQKTTCPHVFLKCFKHIKGLLKHGEFSWKLYCSNFESIRTYFKNKTFFLIYSVPMVIFQIFIRLFLRTIHTLFGSSFPFSLPCQMTKMQQTFKNHSYVMNPNICKS
jgi:hypothetical protein